MTDFKYDTKLHEDARQCSMVAYNPSIYKIQNGYKLVAASKVDPHTGFSAIALRKDNQIIIAFRGTEKNDNKDLENDKIMALEKNIPYQTYEGIKFVKEIMNNKDFNGCSYIFTGHSLGGSLAQFIAGILGAPAITFNAYGVKDILDKFNIKYNSENIINYCNRKDIITCINGDNHIGRIYEMKSKGHGIGLYDHFLENQQPIKEQKEISKYDLNLRGSIKEYYNLNKPIKQDENDTKYLGNTSELYASKVLAAISPANFGQQNKSNPQYNFNNETFGGYRTHNGGQVFVKEYKRKDGTIVKAHWRDWPGTFDPNKKLVDMNEPELGHAIDFWLDEDKYA